MRGHGAREIVPCTKVRPSPLPTLQARHLAGMELDLVPVIANVVPQPVGEGIWALADAPIELIERQELRVCHLRRIGAQLAGEPAEKDIDILVLVHAVIELGPIAAEESERQCAGDTELLAEPAAGPRDRALARPRMAAAGVRPQAARMILLAAALLQQQAPALIDQ